MGGGAPEAEIYHWLSRKGNKWPVAGDVRSDGRWGLEDDAVPRASVAIGAHRWPGLQLSAVRFRRAKPTKKPAKSGLS
jgi:hypothetical protein